MEAGDAQMQVRELNIQIKNKIFKQQKEFSLIKKYRSRVKRTLACMRRWARCTGARYGSGTLRSGTELPQASRRPDGYTTVQVKNSECLFGGRVTQCFNPLSWGGQGGSRMSDLHKVEERGARWACNSTRRLRDWEVHSRGHTTTYLGVLVVNWCGEGDLRGWIMTPCHRRKPSVSIGMRQLRLLQAGRT